MSDTTIEVTNIQLIAVYGMVDALARLTPKAVITLGNEIIQEGRKIAYTDRAGYEAMRHAILSYLTPKVAQVTDHKGAPSISAGYMSQTKEIILTLRGSRGTLWFSVSQEGHIGQLQADQQENMPHIDYKW